MLHPAVPVPDEVPGELMADEILPDELSFDDVSGAG